MVEKGYPNSFNRENVSEKCSDLALVLDVLDDVVNEV